MQYSNYLQGQRSGVRISAEARGLEKNLCKCSSCVFLHAALHVRGVSGWSSRVQGAIKLKLEIRNSFLHSNIFKLKKFP